MHAVTDELRIVHHGGSFGLRLSSLTNTPTGFDRLEVYYREVIT